MNNASKDRSSGPSHVRGTLLEVFLAASGVLAGCSIPPSHVQNLENLPFFDDFERESLGPNWRPTGGHWTIDQGAAFTSGAQNQPLFLEVALPSDLVLEVDVTSYNSTVDAKVELMTDGRKHQSGYIFILGGWKNTISVIARLDEHGRDRRERKPTKVTPKQTYRWRIEKKGGDIKWLIDGQPYMTFIDPHPLDGPGHNRFAFSNWWSQITYDNLKIWPWDNAPPPSKLPPRSPPKQPVAKSQPSTTSSSPSHLPSPSAITTSTRTVPNAPNR